MKSIGDSMNDILKDKSVVVINMIVSVLMTILLSVIVFISCDYVQAGLQNKDEALSIICMIALKLKWIVFLPIIVPIINLLLLNKKEYSIKVSLYLTMIFYILLTIISCIFILGLSWPAWKMVEFL